MQPFPGSPRWLLPGGLLVVILAFGALVTYRSTCLDRPHGDLRVYCRAAWAIREGGTDLYRITDDNGWHYHYPPAFAILMTPFADPPGGQDLASSIWAIPYPVTVVLIYLLNLACLGWAVHLLAGTLEASRPLPHSWSLWWHLRLGPILVCLPPIGLTLARGQVQLLLLLLVAGFLTGMQRGRRLSAGLCLAGAICLKVFPVYLLLVPLLRRDGRCLLGCGLGVVVGLVLLPIAVLGPEVTTQLYQDRWQLLTSVFALDPVLQPGTAELLEATANQSQSFQVVIHKTLYLGSAEIPARPSTAVRLLHWLLAAGFTLATLLPGRCGDEQGLILGRRIGLLALLMVLICPVCHLHYLTLALPLVTSLVGGGRGRWCWLALLVFGMGTALPMLPGLGVLRDVGLALGAACVLWMAGIREGTREEVALVASRLRPQRSSRGENPEIRARGICSPAKCDLRLG